MFFHSEFQPMACDSSSNCSSRGSCERGVCVCSVQFAGDQCSMTNIGFTVAFSSLFSVLFLVSFVQLILCIQAEYRKLKHASLWAACRITTQKLLYFLVLIAALTRVLYFSLMGAIPDKWLETMELAYHPLMITGMSLVVCYWSEAFFLEDVSADASRKGRFLSKSWLAFTIFNLFLYLTVIAQFIVVCTGASGLVAVDHWLNGAFQSFFAVVLFLLYIVFMTVGVEIFFKVRGAFNRREDEPSTSTGSPEDTINTKEVLKSRLAIVFQALFLLLMVLCVVSKAVETLWKDKVHVQTRSIHTILHRMAEVGVVLWFPCVLWKSACPEQLWFLNPRKLLHLRECEERLLPPRSGTHSSYSTFNIPDGRSSEEEEPDCWICYDNDESLGPFISPCLCKGGMSKVHHNCLQRWLMENTSNGKEASCNACKYKYTIHEKPMRMLPCVHYGKRTFIVIPVLALCVAAPCVSVYIFKNQSDLSTPVKVIILGISILISLVCLRVLGVNFSRMYNITRQSAMRILNYDSVDPHSPTSSQTSSSQPQKMHTHRYRTIPSYETIGAEIHVHRTTNDESPDLAASVLTNELSLSSCRDTLSIGSF